MIPSTIPLVVRFPAQRAAKVQDSDCCDDADPDSVNLESSSSEIGRGRRRRSSMGSFEVRVSPARSRVSIGCKPHRHARAAQERRASTVLAPEMTPSPRASSSKGKMMPSLVKRQEHLHKLRRKQSAKHAGSK